MKKTILKIKRLFNSQGFALPLVLGIMAVLLILSFSAYQISINNQYILSKTIDKDKALYQAESGYNQCLWELNSNSYTFYKGLDKSPQKITFKGEPYCKYRLPDGDNYRLEILVPLKRFPGIADLQEDNNNLIIRSTGWEDANPDYLRTIEVEVYKRSFTQHVAVNNTEKSDKGTIIYWTNNDEMYGPFHTNDTLYIDGNPIFHGPVTYGKAVDMKPKTDGAGRDNIYNPNIFRQGNAKTSALPLPTSNPELKSHARISGHYYNGRTCIYLLEDGGYNVRTFDSQNNCWKYNNIEYEVRLTKDGSSNTNVSNLWTQMELEKEEANNDNDKMFHRLDNNTFYSSFAKMAATIPSLDLPANGVIYVDGKKGDGSPTTSSLGRKLDRGLANVFVAGVLKGRLTITAANDIYITGHDPCDWSKPTGNNWFVEPAGVTYQETGFEQNFFDGSDEWSHTLVTGSYNDMLGLVAERKVQILHYRWPSNFNNPRYSYRDFNYSLTASPDYYWNISDDLAPNDIHIYAALYAASQTFGFEEYNQGRAKGDIILYGSITQQYRGPVGTFTGSSQSTGYIKKYSHDPRMMVDAPPYYPNPSDIGWLSARWNETSHHIQ